VSGQAFGSDVEHGAAARQADARWRAVVARDPGGTFVYAVVTTGVFCRPGCSARLPRRENVVFHDSNEAALAAGFRPCLRCRPLDRDGNAGLAVTIARACRTIEGAPQAPTLADLAEAAGISAGHFQRLFKRVVGLSPKQYAIAVRRRRLETILPKSVSVTDAIYAAGYGDAARAYVDGRGLGLPLRGFLDGGAGERIAWVQVGSALGDLVVASTARGVCLVEFLDGRSAEALVRHRFPKATVVPAEAGLETCAGAIVGAIETPREAAPIPLDIRTTAFRESVYRALQATPPGATLSYRALAERIGAPGAARAVGAACAANPLAVVVPCHRVGPADGSLGAYRWGPERKRALRRREAESDDD